MAAFFISHSSQDGVAARTIRDWLVNEGFSSVFLDFDPAAGIPVGREWEAELYSQLRKADVVLFLATGAAIDSKWCHAELVLSRSLGRTIVPVLLEPGAKHPLVRDTQWIRVELDGPRSLRPLGDALRRLHLNPLDTVGWDPQLSPYPGLIAYDERRAGVFFGRESEIETVLDALRRPYGEASERLVLIVGASGSGKSSLLRAGVLTRLRRLESGWTVLPTFAPEDAPLEQLARSFANALGRKVEWQTCHERLQAEPGALKELTRDLARPEGDGVVLISIDQAEQLVTQCTAQDRIAFLAALASGLGGGTQLRAVATLRSEYLSELLSGSRFEGNVAPTVPVGRLSRGGLTEVIERPAQRAGLDLEPGLVARMVEDTVEGTGTSGDPLPLLAFTLQQLYERRATPTRLTFADYEGVGGVVGALKEEAARTYERLQRQGLGDSVLPMLLELAHVEGERRPTSRSVKRDRLGTANEVVQAFIEARLLTSDGNEGNGGTIKVAHEAIFSEWPLLRDEIARSQQQLIARSQLERDAPEWERHGRDPSYLISGARLDSALASGSFADPTIADFVAASRRRNRRQVWRIRALVGVIALMVLFGVVFAARAVFQTRQEHAREADRKRAASAPLVVLPSGSSVDAYQVTNGQYTLCVLQKACTLAADNQGESALPTDPRVMVDAGNAESFCAWIGRRLPASAELNAATLRPDVRFLRQSIPPEGLWEWTSSGKGNTLRNFRIDPPLKGRPPREGKRHLRTADRTWRNFDLVFRCAL